MSLLLSVWHDVVSHDEKVVGWLVVALLILPYMEEVVVHGLFVEL